MSVYKCMGMYDLFLCVEMEGLYHINQQLSELLSCILLDDEEHEFAIELDALECTFHCKHRVCPIIYTVGV